MPIRSEGEERVRRGRKHLLAVAFLMLVPLLGLLASMAYPFELQIGRHRLVTGLEDLNKRDPVFPPEWYHGNDPPHGSYEARGFRGRVYVVDGAFSVSGLKVGKWVWAAAWFEGRRK